MCLVRATDGKKKISTTVRSAPKQGMRFVAGPGHVHIAVPSLSDEHLHLPCDVLSKCKTSYAGRCKGLQQIPGVICYHPEGV